MPVFRKGKKRNLGNYRPVILTKFPGKVMKQILLEIIFRHIKNKKVTGGSQHRFTKWKTHLMALLVNERMLFVLTFVRLLTVYHNILRQTHEVQIK